MNWPKDVAPLWANSKKCFKSVTAVALVLDKSILSAVNDENMIISDLALVKATFNLFSPPCLLRSPNCIVIWPLWLGPNVILKKITSLSSPCTVSIFFTKILSVVDSSLKAHSIAGFLLLSLSSKSSIKDCCSLLKVIMPIDWRLIDSSECVSLFMHSATTALASISLWRPAPLAYIPFTLTNFTPVSFTVGAGNVIRLES